MKSPLVTVIMSVHNGMRFLSDAVRSILDQTFSDFEFLIIDDGSTEPVDEIVLGFGDSRITFIRQINRGLTRSLNRAIDLALGDYLARMDSDDISEGTRLEKQVEQIMANPKLDMVGTYFDIIDENGALIRSKILLNEPLYRLWRLQFHNNYAHGSMLMKKSAVQRAGKYDSRLKYAQDYDLWSRLSDRDNTVMIPEALYRYRLIKHSDQASVKNYDDQLNAAVMISNKSLRASRPDLTDEELIHVRSVYWNFQLPIVSKQGMQLIPGLFDGFCMRYGLDEFQKAVLWEFVQKDLTVRKACDSFTND